MSCLAAAVICRVRSAVTACSYGGFAQFYNLDLADEADAAVAARIEHVPLRAADVLLWDLRIPERC